MHLDNHHRRHLQDARSSTIGKPPVLSGDENTWSDWSFKLRLYVSVVDLQLGRMIEEAELTAHANERVPSAPVNQDLHARLRYLLVMLTSGPARQIIGQQPSGAQAFRSCPECTILVRATASSAC